MFERYLGPGVSIRSSFRLAPHTRRNAGNVAHGFLPTNSVDEMPSPPRVIPGNAGVLLRRFDFSHRSLRVVLPPGIERQAPDILYRVRKEDEDPRSVRERLQSAVRNQAVSPGLQRAVRRRIREQVRTDRVLLAIIVVMAVALAVVIFVSARS